MGSLIVPGEHDHKLKLVSLPFVSTSHLIPVVDIARLFAIHGVDVTIITTTATAAIFQSSIDRDRDRGHAIRTHVVKFPCEQVGLPEGVESFNSNTPRDLVHKIYQGLTIIFISVITIIYLVVLMIIIIITFITFILMYIL